MFTFLLILLVLDCLLLFPVVLLQSGKGGGLAAMGGGASTDTFLGGRQAATLLTKASWTSPGVFAVRVFGQKGLMHYEIDFDTWDTPEKLHETATLYIQRGKDGFANREAIRIRESDMFRQELDLFADTVRTGKPSELTAENANASLAVVYAALRSQESDGRYVKIADVIRDARAEIETGVPGRRGATTRRTSRRR